MLQSAIMKTALSLCICSLLFFSVQVCSAQTSAQELQGHCSHKSADYSAGFCRGFIDAVLDMNNLALITARLNGVKSGSPICIPEGVKMGQVLKVVMKYIDDHPEQLHLPARNLVLDSVANAFPCKE